MVLDARLQYSGKLWYVEKHGENSVVCIMLLLACVMSMESTMSWQAYPGDTQVNLYSHRLGYGGRGNGGYGAYPSYGYGYGSQQQQQQQSYGQYGYGGCMTADQECIRERESL